MLKIFSSLYSLFERGNSNLPPVVSLNIQELDTTMLQNELSADQSVSSETQDKFQRYNISKRIAETILERSQTDCIVLGIYGAWGEGKTSVLNFIEKNLQIPEKVAVVKFNPWRYPDENTLLINFFGILAKALDTNLKTGAENVGKVISEYSSLLKVSSYIDVSGSFKKIGDKMDERDPEKLKRRINKFILESGKKLVIFIDDIDRLDKTEVHTVFRLVKLTADFVNTVYVLSFDEDMVAAAIGERFGQGDQQAGKQFLEKIIQVPLRIPLAQPEALRSYCITLINQLLDTQEITFDDEGVKRFLEGFNNAVLSQLVTPRLAVRYHNTLAFSIPLLKGEVNVVDLMLIEAVKIFYPEHYQFIRTNPDYCVKSYDSVFFEGVDDEKVKGLNSHLDRLSTHLNQEQKKGFEKLFRGLFPFINEALNGKRQTDTRREIFDYRQKRISNESYFRRYFTYAVIKGEFSDLEYERLIEGLKSDEETAINQTYPEIFRTVNSAEVIKKLRSQEEDYTWDLVCKISRMLISDTEKLQDDRSGGIGRSFSPFVQSIICIVNMISKHEDKAEAYDLVESLFKLSGNVDYSLELIRWLGIVEKDNPVFSVMELNSLGRLVLDRTLSESVDRPLHESYPNVVYRLYNIWLDTDPNGLDNYMQQLFQKDENVYIKILYALGAQLSSGGRPAYYSNINDKQYAYITSIVNPELIKGQITKKYTEDELINGKINWEEHWGPYQTDENMVLQFMFWYRKNKADHSSDESVDLLPEG